MGKLRQKGRVVANTTISTLVCTQCGAKMYVPRNPERQREELHKKHMFCFACKKTTAHLEVRARDALKSDGFYIRHKLPTFIKNVKMESTDMFYNDQNKASLYVYVSKINRQHAPLIYDVCSDTIVRGSIFNKYETENIINNIKSNKQHIIELNDAGSHYKKSSTLAC